MSDAEQGPVAVDDAEGLSGRLIARVVAGEEEAFRELYRRHADDLFRFALYLADGADDVAEELVQETWVRAVRGLSRFEGRSSLKTWLCSITVRCAREHRRRADSEARKRERLGEATPARPPAAVPQRLDLRRAIGSLPLGFRTVLILHDVQGMPHPEIARVLGISTGTSKSQLSRARRRVRELLGEDYVTT